MRFEPAGAEGLRITDAPDGNGGVYVVFRVGREKLAVHLRADESIGWLRESEGHPEKYELGGGIHWAHGRLIANGDTDGPRHFYKHMRALGLDFGDIEAELRLLTAYVEDA